ncbi:fimbrial major subunit CsuA/B family protein [Pseudoduganella sp. FT25W]|jgi:spore coat protein U-like protein|uniref:Fimbrial major subunit CsuA/B family protein n=1 Tax=Duganella alba TaxID=2666081 RepID=A0A6L5QA87_9BURK|nr:spore coat U domain-containing protein [Duganella alba]MRX06617.1 fimbrial major subunit CsuA/B family protein [Duganella alba]MRX18033.1 fimbrial major subunit CsuA/B family protein [Duganella alba]
MNTTRRAPRIAVIAFATASLIASLSSAAVYSNGSKTANFDVTLKIIADCIISANALDFGQSQGVLATNVTVNSTLSVTCTNTTPYNVGLNAGTGVGSTTAARVMSGTGANTSTVAYNLLQSSGGSNWGNTQGTDTKSGVGSGVAQTLTVYGVVPAQMTPQPDTYKSTITATVYF